MKLKLIVIVIGFSVSISSIIMMMVIYTTVYLIGYARMVEPNQYILLTEIFMSILGLGSTIYGNLYAIKQKLKENNKGGDNEL